MKKNIPSLLLPLIVTGCSALGLGSGSTSTPPPAADKAARAAMPDLARIRATLNALQVNPDLAGRAPEALQAAASAVAEAEAHSRNGPLYESLVYLADRKVETAQALAEASYFEEKIAGLREQRDALRGAN